MKTIYLMLFSFFLLIHHGYEGKGNFVAASRFLMFDQDYFSSVMTSFDAPPTASVVDENHQYSIPSKAEVVVLVEEKTKKAPQTPKGNTPVRVKGSPPPPMQP
ncbi:OLC1v1026503C1 [Oldenlandia corymbosa var. corymbosa]|uniref:OLC1v1026503C1 n=1 Tax=Oldenlandia corymbosa var. corymbosa TaxID=529605 RepID=A0AAV1C9Z5_OLDCO|nr:OLC1v1026503C1 [Oldenlandia corymbosa var. corymbosa]